MVHGHFPQQFIQAGKSLALELGVEPEQLHGLLGPALEQVQDEGVPVGGRDLGTVRVIDQDLAGLLVRLREVERDPAQELGKDEAD